MSLRALKEAKKESQAKKEKSILTVRSKNVAIALNAHPPAVQVAADAVDPVAAAAVAVADSEVAAVVVAAEVVAAEAVEAEAAAVVAAAAVAKFP